MIDEMRRELAELAAKIERRLKIDAMLQSLRSEEYELAERERSLKAMLLKEENDVGRLERTTAVSILHSILGNKDIKMNKEQQDVYAAKLKYDAAVRQLDDCRIRIAELGREKETLTDCAEQYNQAFLKLQELLRDDPAYAEQLSALERQRGAAVSQLKELDEAVWAGNAAMNMILSIESSLSSAEDWGTWDLIGGGLISDLAKHSHLDEAQEGAEQLQVLLSRFRTELADVYINAEMGALNVDGFLRFADYFFDGLIADWSVLNRIRESQESVYQLKDQVGGALSKLNSIRAVRIAEKESVEKQLEELVTKA